MQITLNGEAREFPDTITLEGLLRLLNLHQERVAVERNREIVKRERWKQVQLEIGDQVEIIHFVGGG